MIKSHEDEPKNEIGVYGLWFTDPVVADKWSKKVKANIDGSPFIAKDNLLVKVWKDDGASDEAMQAVLKHLKATKLVRRP